MLSEEDCKMLSKQLISEGHVTAIPSVDPELPKLFPAPEICFLAQCDNHDDENYGKVFPVWNEHLMEVYYPDEKMSCSIMKVKTIDDAVEFVEKHFIKGVKPAQ